MSPLDSLQLSLLRFSLVIFTIKMVRWFICVIPIFLYSFCHFLSYYSFSVYPNISTCILNLLESAINKYFYPDTVNAML